MRNKILILFLLVGFTVFSQVKIKINDTASPGSTDDQVLTLVGNTLSLEDGGSSIDLSGYLDNNEVVSGVVSGSNLTLTMSDASTVVIDVSSLVGGGGGVSVPVEEEGSQITAAVTKFNFTGTGVTATNVGDDVTVNVPGAGASSNNPNIVIATDQAEVTAAGAGATVSIIDPFTLTADYAPPNNQHWIIASTSGIDLDVYAITNDVTITLPPKGFLGLDMFESDQKINHASVDIKITNDKMYASNFGAIDDNNPATENFNVGRNMIHLANINSGHLVWDEQDTAKYWALPTPRDEFTPGQTPFYPFDNYSTGWVVGNGNDFVTIEHEGGVEIISSTNDLETSRRYVFQDTRGSLIKGGTLRGDRYRHRYNRVITITGGAASAGNITLTWNEVDAYNSTSVQQSYVESIALSTGGANTNATEIANYINTNLSGDGYVASADANVVTIYKEGQDFEAVPVSNIVDAGATGLTNTYNQSPYEWGHAIFYSSMANYCNVENIILTEFHGDGIASLYQGNGTITIQDPDMSVGNIGTNGVIDSGASEYRYLTTTRNLPSQHEWYSFGNTAYTGVDLKHFKYWMVIYDNADNFLYKSKPLVPYGRYDLRRDNDGNYLGDKYRLVVEYPGPTEWVDFSWTINSPSYMVGAVIDQVRISHTRRQGISNPPLKHLKITNSVIDNVGGQQPQFGIDLEDYGKDARGWVIENCQFWNNAQGDIIIKGASQGKIINNFFKQDSWYVRGIESLGVAISTAYGRQLVITGNTFEHRRVTVDIDCKVSNNDFFYSELLLRPGGSIASTNTFINTIIGDGTKIGEIVSQSAAGSLPSIVSNNIMKISDDWGNARLIDEKNTLIQKDNVWLFNYRGIEHGDLTDDSLEEVLVTSNVFNNIASDRGTTAGKVYDAWTDGEDVRGLLFDPTTKTQTGWTKYANDIRGVRVDGPLVIQDGFEKSFHVRDSEMYRLQFDLDEFPTDGVGTFETIEVSDVIVRAPDQIDGNEGFINNSQYGGTQLANLLITPEDVNVNLVFKDCTFDYGTNPAGLFMYLGHRGTTKFINCTFTADASQVINFTSSGSDDTTGVYVGPNTGDIDIINPTKTNVSFTLRAGDTETAW